MIQLEILSGKTAGATWVARRLPVRVGRSPGSDLQLEEQGVWNDHLRIALDETNGFVLEAQPDAIVLANGQRIERAALRNGDLLEIGAVKLRFWLAESRQRRLGIREGLVWAIVAAVCVTQIALIYWLIQF